MRHDGWRWWQRRWQRRLGLGRRCGERRGSRAEEGGGGGRWRRVVEESGVKSEGGRAGSHAAMKSSLSSRHKSTATAIVLSAGADERTFSRL